MKIQIIVALTFAVLMYVALLVIEQRVAASEESPIQCQQENRDAS